MVTMLSLKTILVSKTLLLNTPQSKDVMFEKSMDIKLVHPSKNPSQFSVVLNDLITILPQGCFYNSSVVSINLQKINKIGYQCFISCRKLNKIHLINISVIDTHSFYNCLGLQYVKIESSIVPTLNSTNSFEGTTCKFYVLDSLVDSYKIATNWSTYADRILPISQFATDFPNG